MATWGNLVTDTERLLDDTANDRWSEAVLYGYLDEAQTEFLVLTEIYRIDSATGCLEIPLTSGQAAYKITNIMGPVLRVEDAQGALLSPSTEEFLDAVRPEWRADSGKPKRHFRSKSGYGWLSVYPKPGDNDVSYSSPLKVYCAVRPDAIQTDGTASGQSPVIPAQYHQALPFGAAYRCLLWNQDALAIKLAEAYKNRFMEFVAQAKADVQRVFM